LRDEPKASIDHVRKEVKYQVLATHHNLNQVMLHRDAQLLAGGYFAMLAYNDIFGLTMDDDKTYVCGLTTDLRKAMKQLGFQCFYDASELGASMSYGARIGKEDKWQKLKRSGAPTLQKLSMLQKSLGPKRYMDPRLVLLLTAICSYCGVLRQRRSESMEQGKPHAQT